MVYSFYIEIYENDFSKHNGKVNSGHILMVFGSIVSQLVKANERFMYGAVREGGRARDLLKGNYQFKGPLTENFILQQLRGQFGVEPRYFSDKKSEIDFVLQYGTEVIPIEAKGGDDKSALSFKRYISEHQQDYAIRFSRRGYRKDGAITNLPFYLAKKTKELL